MLRTTGVFFLLCVTVIIGTSVVLRVKAAHRVGDPGSGPGVTTALAAKDDSGGRDTGETICPCKL